jgi:hypothetical protein
MVEKRIYQDLPTEEFAEKKANDHKRRHGGSVKIVKKLLQNNLVVYDIYWTK